MISFQGFQKGRSNGSLGILTTHTEQAQAVDIANPPNVSANERQFACSRTSSPLTVATTRGRFSRRQFRGHKMSRGLIFRATGLVNRLGQYVAFSGPVELKQRLLSTLCIYVNRKLV